jgi:drug/metabolite transporter (DMT)-like permease
MKLSKTYLSVAAFLCTNIIWGAAFPIYKWSLENIDPFTFAFFRFFLAALIILPFTKYKLKIHKDDYLTLIAASLSGITLCIIFWFLGLQLSASINAPIIGTTGPLLTLLFASFFLHEKLKKRTIVGSILSFVGVLFIVIRPLLDSGLGGNVQGNIFFLLATITGIIHGILIKRLAGKYNFISLTFWTFLIGAIGLMPTALFSTFQHGFFPNINYQGILGLIYAAVFSSVIAYSLFAYGMKYLPVNETGIFAYVDPIFAIIVAIPLLGEKITLPYVIGSVLVFAGIYITEMKLFYHPYHKLKNV